jgi:hypothetical protein
MLAWEDSVHERREGRGDSIEWLRLAPDRIQEVLYA